MVRVVSTLGRLSGIITACSEMGVRHRFFRNVFVR